MNCVEEEEAERTEEHMAEDSLVQDTVAAEDILAADIQVEDKHPFHNPLADNLGEEEPRRAVAAGCSNSLLWAERKV